jgi:penicillin-binding protein 1A
MPKRNPPESTPSKSSKHRQRREPEPARGAPGAVSLLFLWPFHLFRLLTQPLGLPLRPLARFFGYPCVAGLYGLLMISILYGYRASGYDLGKLKSMPERTIVLDRNGEELGRIHGEKRDVIPLSQVSETFRKAILAREDERFYQHGAFDPIGMVRAMLKNLEGKREGASTITQQLASDVFQLKRNEGRGETLKQLDRKLLEIAIGIRIESSMEKDEILEAYLNSINWGRQIRGIEEASRIYLEKHASELSLSESAMLAGIVRGPDAFNPFRSPADAKRERDTTLERMVTAEAITRQEADAAKAEPIEVRPKWRQKYQESYAMDAIRHDLELILEKENIELGGLTISTTIDNRIQKKGEEALDKRLREVERISGYPHLTRDAWQKQPVEKRGEPTYLQGSAVVVENHGGAILAVVGGRDANESRFNRALQARRQIGSLFKPFVYLAAFDQGLRPDTLVSDGPIERGEIAGAPATWHPHNSDGKFGGMNPASTGLIRSRNTMSIRVGNHAGMDKVREVSRLAGFGDEFPPKPSSYLGSWESTPWKVASAYTIFPNDGVRYRPYLIREIRDKNNNVLYATPQLSYQAASPGSSWSISRILVEVATSGTAAAVKRLGFDKPCAGKTGTTNDFKDAWFTGYTSSLSCAVWVGFDTPKKTIQGGYGATLALPVWVEMMKTADRLGYRATELKSNIKLVNARLCRQSGKQATAGCEAAGTAYDDRVPADIASAGHDLCPIHPARAIPIEEDTPDSAPPKAILVRPNVPPPLRAQPVEEEDAPPLKAIPVE